MEQLNKVFKTAEEKWINQLNDFCKKSFSKTNIPSHDHTHHLRVWEYSKEIISVLNLDTETSIDLVESCLIASLFHDIGLVKNLDENHGFESRKICETYFTDNKLAKPANFEEILSAIEKHDDKDYKINNSSPDSVLSILCTADDMDAFGNIGVIRYTEIYLLRGVHLCDLPESVIINLDKRFDNFKRIYTDYSELFEKHKARYLNTRKFFEELLEEL